MRIRNTAKILASSLLGLCLFGCGREPIKPETVAQVHKLDDGSYEIELGYTEKTWGGPCNISFHSTLSHGANWLYVKSLDGELGTNEFVITSERANRDYPWAMKDAIGTISFAKDTVTVKLQRPSYADGVHMDGYMGYFLNGTYQMQNQRPISVTP
jgi:hypothetical protein